MLYCAIDMQSLYNILIHCKRLSSLILQGTTYLKPDEQFVILESLPPNHTLKTFTLEFFGPLHLTIQSFIT